MADLLLSVELVQAKQEKAMRALVSSPLNSYGLTLLMIKMVCESSVPTHLSPKSHWEYWKKMEDSSLSDLINEFGKQIQNERILTEVLGDGDAE
jgi:hypothetical protein